MSGWLFQLPARLTDNSGVTYPGAKIYFYATGTATLQAAYSDVTLATPLSNPVICDAGGKPPTIYLDPTKTYRVKATNTDGSVTVYDIDPVAANTLDASSITFIQSGTGAVTRTSQNKMRETISFTDFATGDGTTDDTSKITQAWVGRSGKMIWLNGLTYLVSNLTIPSGTIIQGPGTIKRKAGSIGYMVQGTNATEVQLRDVTFDGNNTGDVKQLVRFDGASDDLLVDGCIFKNSTLDGLAISGTSARARITNNRSFSNANRGIIVNTTGEGSHKVTGNWCRLNGASGILVNSPHVTVESNNCFSNGQTVTMEAGILMITCAYPIANDNRCVNNGTGILFSHGIQFNSCINGTMQGNLSIGNNGSGLDSYISTGTTITGNQTLNNKLRGIEVDSGAAYTTVVGNTVQGNYETGISVYNTVGATVADNSVIGNGTLGVAVNPLLGTANVPYGIALWGAGNYANYARVTGNVITGNIGSGANGIGLFIDPACVGVILSDNTFTGNTSNATLLAANLSFAAKNFGLYFDQKGSAVIASGATSVAVSFPSTMSFTPAPGDITLTAANSPTVAPGELYPTSVTASGFTLNCRTNPGASGLTVGWRCARMQFP